MELHQTRVLTTPINIYQSTFKHAWKETTELAERYSLNLYDACYLELSLRYSLPLSTFDNHLKQKQLNQLVFLCLQL